MPQPQKRRIRAAKVLSRRTPEELLEGIREDHVTTGADKVTARDLAACLGAAPEITTLFKKGPLKSHREEAKAALGLLSDHATGVYPRITFRTVALLVFAFRYVLHQDDLLPAGLSGGHGLADDKKVFEMTLGLVGRDFKAYHRWKAKQNSWPQPLD